MLLLHRPWTINTSLCVLHTANHFMHSHEHFRVYVCLSELELYCLIGMKIVSTNMTSCETILIPLRILVLIPQNRSDQYRSCRIEL